jgi:hypothetical protein
MVALSHATLFFSSSRFRRPRHRRTGISERGGRARGSESSCTRIVAEPKSDIARVSHCDQCRGQGHSRGTLGSIITGCFAATALSGSGPTKSLFVFIFLTVLFCWREYRHGVLPPSIAKGARHAASVPTPRTRRYCASHLRALWRSNVARSHRARRGAQAKTNVRMQGLRQQR